MGLATGVFLSVFRTPFYGCFQKLKRKNISLDDDIVRHKNSRVIKDLSKSDRFFLLGVPKYLATIPFYSLYA